MTVEERYEQMLFEIGERLRLLAQQSKTCKCQQGIVADAKKTLEKLRDHFVILQTA